MKEEILKPLTDRIKQILNLNTNDSFKIVQIDKTLRATEKPIFLGDFIPTDKDGKPLEKPEHYKLVNNNPDYPKEFLEYQQAEAKVLFKGWESSGHNSICSNKVDMYFRSFNKGIKVLPFESESFEASTIESISHLNLPLTNQGKEQIL